MTPGWSSTARTEGIITVAGRKQMVLVAHEFAVGKLKPVGRDARKTPFWDRFSRRVRGLFQSRSGDSRGDEGTDWHKDSSDERVHLTGKTESDGREVVSEGESENFPDDSMTAPSNCE